jgi:type IV fimbrial biogenesis protein FimT
MKARGFSLIELMIVLTILAVLLTIAAPSFSRFIASQRIKTASFDLQSALMLARSEAIKRGPAATVTVAAKSSNWANGWTVTSGGATLAESGPFERIAITEVGGGLTLNYLGNGRVDSANPYAFSLSSDPGVTPSCVRIDTAGVPFSKTYAEGACN